MNRLVIYTCITGGYDSLPEPAARAAGAAYVCYTDTPDLLRRPGSAWEIRTMEPHSTTSALNSRWYKLHPEELFPDYEYSLWIDGNVSIADAGLYERLEAMMAASVKAAGLRHPSRDDIYDEAYRILYGRRETLCKVLKTVKFLKREGMPRHFGLYENNVILRRNADDSVAAFDALWWDTLCRFSGRDQLSQTYCLWKTGLEYGLILPDGSNARNHPYFSYVQHGPVYVKDKTLKGRLADASTALQKSIYRLWAALSGIRLG